MPNSKEVTANRANKCAKTHEIVISFKKEKIDPSPIEINNESIERVHVAKLVGLHIQDNLKWDAHVENIVKKGKI